MTSVGGTRIRSSNPDPDSHLSALAAGREFAIASRWNHCKLQGPVLSFRKLCQLWHTGCSPLAGAGILILAGRWAHRLDAHPHLASSTPVPACRSLLPLYHYCRGRLPRAACPDISSCRWHGMVTGGECELRILMVLWTAPLSRRAQKQWLLTAQVFNAWQLGRRIQHLADQDIRCNTVFKG